MQMYTIKLNFKKRMQNSMANLMHLCGDLQSKKESKDQESK